VLAGLVDVAAAQDGPPVEWAPVLQVRPRLEVADSVEGSGRARGGVRFERGALTASVALQDAWLDQRDHVSLADGWFRVEGDLTETMGLVVRAGRQAVELDEGRLVGRRDALQAGQFLDAGGITVFGQPWELEWIEAVQARIVRAGAHAERAFAAWRVDALWVRLPTGGDTAGGYARLELSRFRGRIESYFQPHGDQSANFTGALAGWEFGRDQRLGVEARYDEATGREHPFAPVLGDRRDLFGALDRWDVPDPGGLADAQLALDAVIAPPVRLRLVGHHVWSPAENRVRGQEMDGDVRWWFSPYGSVSAGGGLTFEPTGGASLARVEIDVRY
jgi:hypothetical protein